MSATTFTPGPWKVLLTPTRKASHHSICTDNTAPIQAVICAVDSESRAHLEQPELAAGNAALIAAAPDMFAALESHNAIPCPIDPTADGNVQIVMEVSIGWLRQAQAALAKAHGSGEIKSKILPDIEIEDSQVIDAMLKYGGGFVQALAATLTRADSENRAALKRAMSKYWTRYTNMALQDAKAGKVTA